MSHEHETPTGGAPTFDDPRPGAPEPDFLARARRILGGDARPGDYLPVTPEVRAAADFELAYVRGHMKREIAPEAVAHQLKGWLLSFHYGGQNIIYVEDEAGVIVLAAGLDQVGDFMRLIPIGLQAGIVAGCPEPF